jgi:hypothetical protein
MSYSNNPIQKETATLSDASATGDKLTFTPAKAVEVVGFGIIVTTALADAADGLVLKADIRPTAGSDSSRGDGDAGTLTLTQAQADGKAAGKVVRCRPTSHAVVYPGQQVVLDLTTAVDSGAGIAFIEFREAFKGDQSNETVVTA